MPDRLLRADYYGAAVIDVPTGSHTSWSFEDRHGKRIQGTCFGLARDVGAYWSPSDSALRVWWRDQRPTWLPVKLPQDRWVRAMAVQDAEVALVLSRDAGVLFVRTAAPGRAELRTDLVDARAARDGWAVVDRHGNFWLVSEGTRRPLRASAPGRSGSGWDYAVAQDAVAMAVSRTRVEVPGARSSLRAPLLSSAGVVAACGGTHLLAVTVNWPFSTGGDLLLWSPVTGQRRRVDRNAALADAPVMVATPEVLALLRVGAVEAREPLR